jgi:ligand-binding sensor domain-containing protein
MMRLYSLLLIACLILPASGFGAAADWEVFFSLHTVRSLIRVGPDLWGASNGGLFRFHLPDKTFQTFTNAEGLSSNDIRAMTLDGRGNLVLGMGNAYVDMFNLTTHQVTHIPDFRSNSQIFQIYALYNDQGTIYAGTDLGVSRLTFNAGIGRYLIQGNFNHLIPEHPEVPVKAISVFDGDLWAGTSEGLARGDLSSSYLESPEAWTNFTTANGLSGNDISALEIFHDTLYIAVTGAPFSLNKMSGSSFINLQVPNDAGISFLKVHADTLVLGRIGGIYWLENGAISIYGTVQATGLAAEFDEDGSMWGGFQTEWNYHGGLAQYMGSSEGWTFYRPEGPRFEQISDILVENDGSVWVTGRQVAPENFNNGGLAHYDGRHWVNLTRPDDIPLFNPVSSDSLFWDEGKSLTKDLDGNLWLGVYGRGVGWFRWTGDTILANGYYGAASGRLWGIDISANYCVVQSLLTDTQGNIWICNSFATGAGAQPIAIVPADFIQDTAAFPNWAYLTPKYSSGSTIEDGNLCVDRISQDSFGNKWFGAYNNAAPLNNDHLTLRVLDDNGTLSESDDHWYALTNLPSDSVSAMALDRDGIMWVGTSAGVRYYYTTANPQLLIGYNLVIPVSQNVRTIVVDPQNNKWFGTTDGLSVLGADDYTWLANYTTIDGDFPSPLPGSVVNAIDFDPSSGDAYIGTDKGLVRLKTPYQATGPNVVSVNLWPNPFIVGEGLTGRLNFDMMGMTGDTKIKIFTTSGLLVRQLSTTDVGYGWDGRNGSGDLVASGVYLLLAYSSNGSAHTGKVAVVHQ